MEYKVLVDLLVPEIEETYEVYIPVNKTIGEVTSIITKMVQDRSKIYPNTANVQLCHRHSGVVYDDNQLVRDSDIRNGTEIILSTA